MINEEFNEEFFVERSFSEITIIRRKIEKSNKRDFHRILIEPLSLKVALSLRGRVIDEVNTAQFPTRNLNNICFLK